MVSVIDVVDIAHTGEDGWSKVEVRRNGKDVWCAAEIGLCSA